jgi:hypothetical protein
MSSMPHMGSISGHPVLMVDGRPFIMLAGEVHNSSSSSLQYMEPVWKKAEALGMNCLLLPVTWELVEPEEGQFDFSLVQGLIEQARAHGMKIAFLWFGAWKNAQCYYAPAWVKTDTQRFRRAEIKKGKGFIRIRDFYDMPYTSLSYLCEETRQADARAFGRLMAFIREIDGEKHTVLTVQIENETGVMGAAREHSDQADELFGSSVPDDFAAYMHNAFAAMTPDMKRAVADGKPAGTWTEVFGPEAEEVFSAYHIARYVNTVAEAGKRAYPLPFSVNCWLNKAGDQAGVYPSGGPISKMREVWRFCAPNIDLYAPDIYLPDFSDICGEYTRRGEALFIPECATHQYAAARNILCVGRYHAVCYSPFGFEDMGLPLNAQQMALFGADATDPALKTPQDVETYGAINRLLSAMMDLLTGQYGTENLQAGSGENEKASVFRMDGVEIHADYLAPQGACLVLRNHEKEFYVLAYEATLSFLSSDPQKPGLDFTLLEEGSFSNGIWQRGRRLNGDEAVGITFERPVLLRVRVFQYA